MRAAGYSGTPLLKKLGVKEGQTALLIAVPDAVETLARFDGWKTCVRLKSAEPRKGPFDYIHMFTTDRAEYAKALPVLKSALAPSGMIWASWPKKTSGVASTVSENDVRSLALKAGLVDIKVCAVDAIWSGLKLVIPVRDR